MAQYPEQREEIITGQERFALRDIHGELRREFERTRLSPATDNMYFGELLMLRRLCWYFQMPEDFLEQMEAELKRRTEADWHADGGRTLFS